MTFLFQEEKFHHIVDIRVMAVKELFENLLLQVQIFGWGKRD